MKRLIGMIMTVFLSFAVAAPATQTDLEAAETAISVSIELDTPMEEIQFGSPLRLRCVVIGLEEPYFYQWQYSRDLEEWINLPCTDEVFEFILDEENADVYYRVVVSLGERDENRIEND